MLRKIETAGDLPITLQEAKQHCRAADFDDDDALILAFLTAAVEFVSDRTSLALARQQYRIEREGWWTGCLEILVAPVREIISVSYIDTNGDAQTVSESNYRWVRTSSGAQLYMLASFASPAVQTERKDAVRVDFEVGYDVPGITGSGDDPDLALPERAKQAALLLTAFWYDNRAAVSLEAQKPIPLGAEALMAQLRNYT